MNKLYIGWAEESLLPGKKIALAGQFYERVSDEIDTPLLATAMAVEKDGQQAIIVSADIGEVQPFLLNLAREEFARLNSEIAPEKLIFGATHTHTSHTFGDPATNLSISPVLQIINEYIDRPTSLRLGQPLRADEAQLKRLMHAAVRIREEEKSGQHGSAAFRILALGEILTEIGRLTAATYPDGQKRQVPETFSLRPVFNYIRQHYCEAVTLAELAAQGLTLAGAVHDFTDPVTGRNYLCFPIRRLEDA
jgi:hypothetical protein